MMWQEIITKSVRMVSYKEGERENRGRRIWLVKESIL